MQERRGCWDEKGMPYSKTRYYTTSEMRVYHERGQCPFSAGPECVHCPGVRRWREQ